MTAREIERDGFAAVALLAGELEATFVPGAGMVGASLRHRGDELLGQRAGLRAYAERGSTMGIPLLHPWANRLSGDIYTAGGRRVDLGAAPRVRRDPGGLPIHGLLAGVPHWRVTGLDADGAAANCTAALDVGAHVDLTAGFPFPHALSVHVALDAAALRVTTTVRATGDVAVPIAFGWHPYLVLPGVPRARWRVTLPARRHLLTDARGLPTGATEPLGAEEEPLGVRTLDDGYDALATAAFTLAGGGRSLTVTFDAGYPCAQAYAPGDQDVVCFEPMTAPTNALVSGDGLRSVAPGATFSAAFAISVR